MSVKAYSLNEQHERGRLRKLSITVYVDRLKELSAEDRRDRLYGLFQQIEQFCEPAVVVSTPAEAARILGR